MADYKELVKALREPCPHENCILSQQAAEAIEELSRKYTEERNAAVELTGELASKPHWIPVTEKNHPKAYEPVMVVYVGWNDALPHRDITAYWSEDEEVWRWAETNDKVKVPITHYMSLPPLPEPPKEDADAV